MGLIVQPCAHAVESHFLFSSLQGERVEAGDPAVRLRLDVDQFQDADQRPHVSELKIAQRRFEAGELERRHDVNIQIDVVRVQQVERAFRAILVMRIPGCRRP